MVRDYRALLADHRCWDRRTQAVFEATGLPLDDCILQNREELIALCELIEREGVRSYLEVGVWTGRLVTLLQALFDFELVAACDLGLAQSAGLRIRLPFGVRWFPGSSRSPEYRAFLAELARERPIDLVLIDADHAYDAVRADFDLHRTIPHRMLALHDITGANPTTHGVARLWRELRAEAGPDAGPGRGRTTEIIRPHRELGLPHSTMGIGVWRSA